MPQKSKARGGPRKAGKAGARKVAPSDAKTQSERFIEAARMVGVDESGKEFDRALKRLVQPRRHKG